jgi:hypothetical protein
MFGILFIVAGTAGGLTLRKERLLTLARDFLSGITASRLTRVHASRQCNSHQFF